jgi:hypothetical protein
MLRCVNDGLRTIKPGRHISGDAVFLHAVPYMRKSLRLENTIPYYISHFRKTMQFSKTTMASIHTAGTVRSWFEEHEGELQHLPWPVQSPDLSIAESLWSVLETRLRNRFPPPTSLKQLEGLLQDVRNKIPLETVQNLYECIASRIDRRNRRSTPRKLAPAPLCPPQIPHD